LEWVLKLEIKKIMFNKNVIRKQVMATINARINDAEEKLIEESENLQNNAMEKIDEINIKLESDKKDCVDKLVKEIIG